MCATFNFVVVIRQWHILVKKFGKEEQRVLGSPVVGHCSQLIKTCQPLAGTKSQWKQISQSTVAAPLGCTLRSKNAALGRDAIRKKRKSIFLTSSLSSHANFYSPFECTLRCKFASCDPKEMTKSIFRDLVPLRPRHFLSIAATSSQHFLQQNGELA